MMAQTISIDLQKIDSSTLGLNGFSVSGQSLNVSDSERLLKLPVPPGQNLLVLISLLLRKI